MSYDDLLRLLSYLPATEIFERQALIREYCYLNNIDFAKLIR